MESVFLARISRNVLQSTREALAGFELWGLSTDLLLENRQSQGDSETGIVAKIMLRLVWGTLYYTNIRNPILDPTPQP